MIQINIIGAGRVGQTLIELILPLANYQLQAICSQHYQNNAIPVVSSAAELPPADIVFITVADRDMEKTIAEVCQHHRDTILAHCCGSMPAAILNPDNRDDLQTVSVHPPICVVNPKIAAEKFKTGVCTIEGDPAAVQLLTDLFHAFGTQLAPIDPAQKAAYHAAGAIVANYLVTLSDAACQQYTHAGIEEKFGKQIVEQLIQSVLDNLKDKTHHRDALSGPIVRNDQNVVKKHLEVVKPELKKLYCDMGLQTADIAGLSAENLQAMKALLS